MEDGVEVLARLKSSEQLNGLELELLSPEQVNKTLDREEEERSQNRGSIIRTRGAVRTRGGSIFDRVFRRGTTVGTDINEQPSPEPVAETLPPEPLPEVPTPAKRLTREERMALYAAEKQAEIAKKSAEVTKVDPAPIVDEKEELKPVEEDGTTQKFPSGVKNIEQPNPPLYATIKKEEFPWLTETEKVTLEKVTLISNKSFYLGQVIQGRLKTLLPDITEEQLAKMEKIFFSGVISLIEERRGVYRVRDAKTRYPLYYVGNHNERVYFTQIRSVGNDEVMIIVAKCTKTDQQGIVLTQLTTNNRKQVKR